MFFAQWDGTTLFFLTVVLNGRFSRETLADFMQKYMDDGQTEEEVEERGRQLQETIL